MPEGATPLFQIDHDGRRYTQTPDGTRRELGYDRMAAARAGIAPREAAARKALDQTLARGAEHYGGFIEEYRRRQADIHQYKTAAAETPQDSEWQKTARSAHGDPRTWDTQLIAEVEKRDPAKAAAMRQALLPQPTKRLFDAAEKSFAGADAAGGQPAAEASDSVPGKSMTLHEMLMQAPAMMQGQGGDQPPADLAAAARSTAQHALGISDPENVRVTRSADGTYTLSRPAADGSGIQQPFATLDPKTNRLTLSPGPDGQAAISMAAKGSPHGIPIYLPGTQPPLSAAERSELIARGLHATSTTTDRQQADAALTQAGLSPQGIRQLVNEGRLSVQDGQFLNDKFNGGREAQANTTQPPSPQGFAAWVTDESNPRSAWWRNGTDEQKAVAVHEYYDALAAGRMGDGHTTPEGIENLRRQALGDIRPEWGKPGTTTPGQARQTGAARFESIPLKDGGKTLLPGGKWTVEDLEKLHENPVFAKATQTERDAVMNHVIGQSFTDYSGRPGFDQAAYQRFNQIAQQARDRSAALKTWSDTGSDALNFGGNVVGGVVRPVIATATDLSAKDPDGEWRSPLGNVAEQAGYWGQKAKDTLHGFLPAARAANSKLGSELESLHQDLINGNFPLNDRTKLDEWLAARSKGLTDSQKAWYEAVQGKPDTSTDKGLSQHIYTHANSLLNPANAELVSKFIQTRDPAVWDELHRNLTRTPQRAETEQAQQKSLEESKIVNFMTKNYGGGDYAEHMQSAGNPIDIASNLLPMVRGLRAGKAAAEAAVLAGKSTLKGSAAAIAKSAAINLGTGGVQTLVENPDATFADLAQAGKENIATALGLHAVGHVAGKALGVLAGEGKADRGFRKTDSGPSSQRNGAEAESPPPAAPEQPASAVDAATTPQPSNAAPQASPTTNGGSEANGGTASDQSGSYPHAADGDYRSNWKTSTPGRRVKLEDGREGVVTSVAKDHTLTVDVNGKSISGVPQQKVKMQLTPDELAAEQAFIKRHQSFQKLKPVYDQRLDDIAKSLPEAHVILAPLKGAPRALEKAAQATDKIRPGGKFHTPEKAISKLTDMLRGSIVVDSLDQVPQATSAVLRSFAPDAKQTGTTKWGAHIYETGDGGKVIVNDRFKNPTAEGYSDVQIMLEMTPGHMVEIQIHIPEMLAAKEGDAVKKMGLPEKYWPENLPINGFDPKRTGHHMYEEKRSLPEESANADSVAQEMKSLYQAAMDAHFKRKSRTKG
ncbi:MAG: nucleotidyltransferase family protein [Prosthecobacter sp.]